MGKLNVVFQNKEIMLPTDMDNVVLELLMENATRRTKALKYMFQFSGVVSACAGVIKITLVGEWMDVWKLTTNLKSKMGFVTIVSVTKFVDEKVRKEEEDRVDKGKMKIDGGVQQARGSGEADHRMKSDGLGEDFSRLRLPQGEAGEQEMQLKIPPEIYLKLLKDSERRVQYEGICVCDACGQIGHQIQQCVARLAGDGLVSVYGGSGAFGDEGRDRPSQLGDGGDGHAFHEKKNEAMMLPTKTYKKVVLKLSMENPERRKKALDGKDESRKIIKITLVGEWLDLWKLIANLKSKMGSVDILSVAALTRAVDEKARKEEDRVDKGKMKIDGGVQQTSGSGEADHKMKSDGLGEDFSRLRLPQGEAGEQEMPLKIPPEIDLNLLKDSERKVNFSTRELLEARHEWRGTLIARLFGTTCPQEIVKRNFMEEWGSKGLIAAIPLGGSFYVLRFKEIQDGDKVLSEVPWSIACEMIALERWKPNFRPSAAALAMVPSWIRFPELPMEYWKPKLLLRIAAMVGVPLELDSATRLCEHGEFARVCVQLDFSRPVVRKVTLVVEGGDGFDQEVQYEGICVCDACDRIGHQIQQCVAKLAGDGGDGFVAVYGGSGAFGDEGRYRPSQLGGKGEGHGADAH